MKWHLFLTDENTGQFNMQFDLNLAKNCKPDTAVLRLYRWNPYCISLGANQSETVINIEKTGKDGIDLVKRPTGGRAILHSEELTYSVVYPIAKNTSAKALYFDINNAISIALKIYDKTFENLNLELHQPDFRSLYSDNKNSLCFAVAAKNEIKFGNKKLVGSAQRKLNNVILQHGSIICGNYHKKIIDYLLLNLIDKQKMKAEMDENTISIYDVTGSLPDYNRLSDCLINGFEQYFSIKFEEANSNYFV